MERRIAETIIDEYKNALIDRYTNYLEIIDDINLSIGQFVLSNNIKCDDTIYFDYVSFCELFIETLRTDLHFYESFDNDTMQEIYESVIYKKTVVFTDEKNIQN